MPRVNSLARGCNLTLTREPLLSSGLPLDRFIGYTSERHKVYLRRQAGMPKPWTLDSILQHHYFCNDYRELDKVTVWLRQNVREPLAGKPEVLFATVCFRWFNWIPTGELLLGRGMEEWSSTWPRTNLLLDWDCRKAINRLYAQKNHGQHVFTNAFMITNGGLRKPKIDLVCENYVQPVWERRHDLTSLLTTFDMTLAATFKELQTLAGFGGTGFMAAQAVADLKYTYLLPRDRVSDWWSWCCLGPGSKKGLNIVLGRPVNGPPPADWRDKITWLRDVIARRLPWMEPFHAQDCQNLLCEMSKFERIHETGRGKRHYQGGAV